MKALQLKINERLYDTLLAMLKGLPKKDIEIIESNDELAKIDKHRSIDIMQFSGTIQWPVDGVAYQRKIRDEEWQN